jgi:uncharacterized protein YecT (DUF1311 family)
MADAIIMPGEIERSCGHATPTSSMIIQPFVAFALAARIAAAALIVVASVVSAAARDRASAGVEARAEDRAAVASCLDLVAQAHKRHYEAVHKAEAAGDGAPKSDKTDPAEWLRHAGERADIDETSCIGVVSTPCQQTYDGRTEAGTAACMRRELAVWDERLNKGYRQWIDACGETKVCAARRKFARAWLAARDARCALPLIEMQGTMADPLTDFCLLDVTARHAIWLGADR